MQTNVTKGWRSSSTFLDHCYLTFKCILTTLNHAYFLNNRAFLSSFRGWNFVEKVQFCWGEKWCWNCTFNDSIGEKFSKDYKHQNKHQIQCPICNFLLQIRCQINAQFSWDNYAYQSIQETLLKYIYLRQIIPTIWLLNSATKQILFISER